MVKKMRSKIAMKTPRLDLQVKVVLAIVIVGAVVEAAAAIANKIRAMS